MESNIQEFPCIPWPFAEMQRCLNYVTCNSSFRDRSASCCSFQYSSNCYIFLFVFGFMAGNRSTSLILLESVSNMVTQSMSASLSAAGGACSPGGAEVFVRKHGLVIASSLGLGLPFKNLLLPHGVIQCAVGIVCFLLRDKKLTGLRQTLCRVVLFGQRAHCLWVITDECRIEACHFHAWLLSQVGGGVGGFNSFCHPDIKNLRVQFRRS